MNRRRKVRPGRMRHKVVIKSPPSGTPNWAGEPSGSEATVATLWAMIEPLAGREMEKARQVVATATHRVTIRSTSGVDPTCRVYFGSRIFEVGSVLDADEVGHRMDLICTEKV